MLILQVEYKSKIRVLQGIRDLEKTEQGRWFRKQTARTFAFICLADKIKHASAETILTRSRSSSLRADPLK